MIGPQAAQEPDAAPGSVHAALELVRSIRSTPAESSVAFSDASEAESLAYCAAMKHLEHYFQRETFRQRDVHLVRRPADGDDLD